MDSEEHKDNTEQQNWTYLNFEILKKIFNLYGVTT